MRRLLPPYDGERNDDAALDDQALARAYTPPPADRWLRANMVASVDGAAAVSGRSGGLSSPADKKVFALLRNLCDVVLVGAGTVRTEGYRPARRSPIWVERRQAEGRQDVPAIAVVTGSLELDQASSLFTEATVRTIIVTSELSAAERGAAFAGVADFVTTPGERLDMAAAVDALVAGGLRHILCEGGPKLLAEIAAADRLDELCLTISPLLVAGGAPRAMNGLLLDPPVPLTLTDLLAEDEMLFARYRVRR